MLERECNDAMPFLSFRHAPSRRLSLACWPQMFSRPSGVGCASGCDDGVTGVVAGLLVHGQVADAVSSVSSRLARRRADRIRPRFRLGDLPPRARARARACCPIS